MDYLTIYTDVSKGKAAYTDFEKWERVLPAIAGKLARQHHNGFAYTYIATRLQIMGDNIMAKRKRAGAQTDWEKAEWAGFVKVEMTSDDKAALMEWNATDSEVMEMVTEAIAQGHKLSISPTNGGRTVVASFTGAYSNSANPGQTLSSYASNWVTALRVLVYKHYVMTDGIWDSHQPGITDDIG